MFYIWTPKQQHKQLNNNEVSVLHLDTKTEKPAQPKSGKCFTSEHQNNSTKQLNRKEMFYIRTLKQQNKTAQPKGDVLHQDTKTAEQNSSSRRICFTSGHQNSRTKQLNRKEMFYIRTLKQQNKTAQPEGDKRFNLDTKTTEQNSSTKRR